jgi:SAM-dependent methyltransferase
LSTLAPVRPAYLKRWRAAVIAAHIATNEVARRRARRGELASISGGTHRDVSGDVSLAYIERVYEDYVEYGGLRDEDIAGARVLEVGAGDNFGVAIRFLAAGAAEVVCLDRFVTRRDDAQQRGLNAALVTRLSAVERERVADVVAPDGSLAGDTPRLRIAEGVPIESAERLLGAGRFDLVVSRAVLEHVMSVERSLTEMDRVLVPGGLMLHKVDLRDHGMFSAGGMHPLTFLTVRPTVYRWMTSHTGAPNRTRACDYRSTLRGLGYDVRLLVTHVLGVAEELVPHREEPEYADASRRLVRAIRPSLAAPFAPLAEEDLLVEGVFVIARKPAGHPPPRP